MLSSKKTWCSSYGSTPWQIIRFFRSSNSSNGDGTAQQVARLLDLGANPSQLDTAFHWKYDTALAAANAKGATDIVDLLVARGAVPFEESDEEEEEEEEEEEASDDPDDSSNDILDDTEEGD
jgi:hypothetical protein